MPAPDSVLAQTKDPDGRVVVVLARIWEDKILRDHPELEGALELVSGTIETPDHTEPDPRVGRHRYYRRQVGPSRWLLVVVSYEQEPARIISAFGNRKDPRSWSA